EGKKRGEDRDKRRGETGDGRSRDKGGSHRHRTSQCQEPPFDFLALLLGNHHGPIPRRIDTQKYNTRRAPWENRTELFTLASPPGEGQKGEAQANVSRGPVDQLVQQGVPFPPRMR